MPKKIKIDKLREYNFSALAKREKNPRIRVRLLALMHIQNGKSVNAVASLFGVRWRTARAWLDKFLSSGIKGLGDKPRSGRKPHLQANRIEEFKQAIQDLQAKRKGGRIIGKDIQKLLSEQFAAKYDLDSIYKLLKKIDFVWITARSVHPNANQEAQEAFKKTSTKR